jgi:hypothetical protein
MVGGGGLEHGVLHIAIVIWKFFGGRTTRPTQDFISPRAIASRELSRSRDYHSFVTILEAEFHFDKVRGCTLEALAKPL